MDAPPPLKTFYLYHRAMRDGADELVAALEADPLPDDLARVTAWFDFYREACLNHAGGEDDVLWPELLAEQPDVAPLVDRMDHEHARLHDLLDATSDALHAGRLADARRTARELREVLVAHVDGEERDALPQLPEVFPGDALDGVIQRLQQHSGPEGTRIALSFFLAVADPDEKASVLAMLPPHLRATYESEWRDEYAALHAAVA